MNNPYDTNVKKSSSIIINTKKMPIQQVDWQSVSSAELGSGSDNCDRSRSSSALPARSSTNLFFSSQNLKVSTKKTSTQVQKRPVEDGDISTMLATKFGRLEEFMDSNSNNDGERRTF